MLTAAAHYGSLGTKVFYARAYETFGDVLGREHVVDLFPAEFSRSLRL